MGGLASGIRGRAPVSNKAGVVETWPDMAWLTEGSRTVGKTLSERVEMGMAGGIVDETEGWLP